MEELPELDMLKMIVGFMGRTQLTGAEALAHTKCMAYLSERVNTLQNAPPEEHGDKK